MNASDFGFDTTAEEVTEGLDLSGRTYLVTGVNSGLGLETIRVLGLRGARIVGLARTVEKARGALTEAGVEGHAIACELSEPASVRSAAKATLELSVELDGVICNAGIMAVPEARREHGLELQFLTNHVGHHLLATSISAAMTSDGRLVVVSSGAHHFAPPEGIRFDDLGAEREYSPWVNYGQSKLANILFARHFAEHINRAGASERTVNALHPGVIRTNLARHAEDEVEKMIESRKLPVKTVGQGAATQCFVATHPSLAGITGRYFSDCQEADASALSQDDALAERLWEATEAILADI